MITAKFKKDYCGFDCYKISGHANFAEKGKDIVCAAVSSLYLTVTNYLLTNEYAFIDDEQTVQLIDGAQVATEILYQGLVDIAEQYPDYVAVEVECRDSRFLKRR